MLRPDTFAALTVPSWIPQPHQLLRFAKVIYPYWKERRVERGGHRILPTLNVRLLSFFAPCFIYDARLIFTRVATFWAPSVLLSSVGGLKDKAVRRAWREKMALCFIILVLCALIGFATVGLQ